MSLPLFLIPFSAYITAALIKTCIASLRAGHPTLKGNGLGGMPSSHNAFTASISALTGWFYGMSGPLFALSLGLLFIVAIDAMDLRQRIGTQASLLKKLVPEEDKTRLRTRIGHHPHEVVAGIIWGTALTLSLLYSGMFTEISV
jgi:acid phosphatase family membrane protein YuiD